MRYTGVIQALYRRYTGAIPALYRRYTGAIPALYRRYTCTVIRMYDRNYLHFENWSPTISCNFTWNHENFCDSTYVQCAFCPFRRLSYLPEMLVTWFKPIKSAIYWRFIQNTIIFPIYWEFCGKQTIIWFWKSAQLYSGTFKSRCS